MIIIANCAEINTYLVGIPIIPLIFRVCAKQKVEAKHFENCHLVTLIRFFNYFFPITKPKL